MQDVRFERAVVRFVVGRAADHCSEACFTGANTRGIMASGHAGALRLLAGAEPERELQAQMPLLIGEAYLTGPGRLAQQGVARIVHAVLNVEPGEPTARSMVEHALDQALELIDRQRTRALTLPEVGQRIPHV